MFRIPEYVAETRLDGAAPPAMRVSPAAGRSITRLGSAFAGAGDRLARQAKAAGQAEAAGQRKPAFTAEPFRPPSAEEQRLADHIDRRRAQAGTFAAERRYLDLQAEADAAQEKARAAAGPSGEGFTRLYARELGLLGEKLQAGLPAELADEQRAAIDARLRTDHERRLARAAAEEVESSREQTRAELAGMQAALLAQLAREPERYEEIAAQGAAFTAGNILPDEETAARVADWFERTEMVKAEARDEQPAIGGADPHHNRDDPVIAVIDNPGVRKAWDALDRNPTPANRHRLSEAFVEAQRDAGVPIPDLTPVPRQEERELAQTVQDADGQARIDAIRQLAARLQTDHGAVADLALKSIARHWADDKRATAFAEFLAGEIGGALIIDPDRAQLPQPKWRGGLDANSRVDRAFIDAEGYQPGKQPLSKAWIAYAEEQAKKQRTSPIVRDQEGNFLRGEPLGEAFATSDGVAFYDRNGALRLAEGRDHVVLLDPVSGRSLVFNRIVEHDSYHRLNVLPLAINRRTRKIELALPNILHDPLEALKLPGDVLAGRIDPNSPEARGRITDLAGTMTGSGLVTRAKPGSAATGLRRPPKPGSSGKYDVVEIKTTPARSSNAVRGRPEHEALNNPKPNTIYKLDNGETFRTNRFGIVDEIEYKPSKDKRARNKLQTQVGKLGLEDDVGGHIRGARHGGTADRYNLIPQNSNFNSGAYKKWENEIFSQIDNVEFVRIVFRRKKPSDPRPDSMKIIYKIGGEEFTRKFENSAGGRKP